ncbi:MAG: serine hydrolase domain-containing protein [Chloroflexota bacterium]
MRTESMLESIIPSVSPDSAGLSPERLQRVSELLRGACQRGDIPGAVAAVARRGKCVFHEAFGAAALFPERRAMTRDTLFDLASLTKVVATLPTTLTLIDEGAIRLDDAVARVIPEFAANGKDNITIRHALSHTSGLIWWRDFSATCRDYDDVIAAIAGERLDYPMGSKVVYSDLNFIILGEVVRRVTGLTLDRYAADRVFAPLGMQGARFCPPPELKSACAATEYRAARDVYQCGEVHDENAALVGGVSGHAGLFATAADLLLYGQAWLNGGSLADAGLPGAGRILSPAVVAAATSEQTAGLNDRRALGWLMKTREFSSGGDLLSNRAYGHTGFTGTSLWVDPELELVAVLLTNRVHPTRDNNAIIRLRPRFHNLVAAAIDDWPPASAR